MRFLVRDKGLYRSWHNKHQENWHICSVPLALKSQGGNKNGPRWHLHTEWDALQDKNPELKESNFFCNGESPKGDFIFVILGSKHACPLFWREICLSSKDTCCTDTSLKRQSRVKDTQCLYLQETHETPIISQQIIRLFHFLHHAPDPILTVCHIKLPLCPVPAFSLYWSLCIVLACLVLFLSSLTINFYGDETIIHLCITSPAQCLTLRGMQ